MFVFCFSKENIWKACEFLITSQFIKEGLVAACMLANWWENEKLD